MKTPIVGTKSRVLVPGLPGHQAPVKATTQGSEKRKKDSGNKEVGGSAPLLRHPVAAKAGSVATNRRKESILCSKSRHETVFALVLNGNLCYQ